MADTIEPTGDVTDDAVASAPPSDDAPQAIPSDAEEPVELEELGAETVSDDDEPTPDEGAAADVDPDKDEEDADAAAEGEEDADGESDDEDQDTEDGDEPEMLAFDFGGNTLEVPKDSVPPELATKIDEFTKGTWATFTKGQQENVERSKTLDSREQAVAKITQLNGEALQTYSQGLQLRSDIEQLSAVDLNALWNSPNPEDRDRARQISDTLSEKQAEFQQVVARVGQQENALSEAQQAEKDRRTAEGIAQLDSRFKNFSTEKAPKLVRYVVDTYGMPEHQAADWAANPIVTEMAYKAMLYDQQTKARKKPTSQPKPATPVKPAKASGKAGPPKDPDKMSMGQLSKHLGIPQAPA